LASAGLAALAAAALCPPAWLDRAPVVCLFRRVAALPCPTCGLTRSVVATLHGDLLVASGLHAFGPGFAATACVVAIGVLAGKPRWEAHAEASRGAWARGAATAGALAWIVYVVGRVVA